MHLKEEYKVTLLERSGKIEEAITVYEKAELFKVAGMLAEKDGRIEKAIECYEKAGLLGLSCELEHGRHNDKQIKEIEAGGIEIILRDLEKYEERAGTGYYDGELEWGPEQWERQAWILRQGLKRLRFLEGKNEPKSLAPSYYPSRKQNLLCSKNPFNKSNPDRYSPEKISKRKKDYFAGLEMFGQK